MSPLPPGDEGVSLAESICPMEDQSPGAPVKAPAGDEASPNPGTARRLSGWWQAKSI